MGTNQLSTQIFSGNRIKPDVLAARNNGWEKISCLCGQKYQNGPDRRLLQHFEEGIACRRIHCLGIGYNHEPRSCLIRFHGKVLTKGTDLIDSDEWTGRLYADDVRMVIRFNSAT